MAAPSGTVWGAIVNGSSSGRKGRIGIYTSVSNTDTKTTVNVQVWFWTIYSCLDGYNDFYFDVGTGISAATTRIGAVDINHTVATGEGWNTANQTRLINKTYTYNRGTTATTYKVYAKYSGIDMIPSGTMYANTTYTVPKLASYTVTYNANGGTGAPSSQTKWFGTALKLSTSKPSRTGYTFQGWATSSGGGVSYAAGASYTANANITLYAVWKAVTYTVTYNANGGTGAPSSQTKTHGVTLKLSTVKPTRTNYTFLGWATSASATAKQYDSGGNYTANQKVTLYAVWSLAYTPPRITNLDISRCDSNGTVSDMGASVRVKFNFACDKTLSGIKIAWESTAGQTGSVDGQVSGNSVNQVISTQVFNTETTYTFEITVTDASGYSVIFGTLTGTAYAIDFYAGGKGVAFNKPAEMEGVLDINLRALFRGGIYQQVLEPETNLNDVMTPNTYIGVNSTDYNYANCPLTSGTFTLEVNSAGEAGQVWQKLTMCSKSASQVWERFYYGSAWGTWTCTATFGGKVLWSGGLYMTAAQVATLSESVSKQPTGIQLVFSRYSDGKSQNYHFQSFFVSKYEVTEHAGCGRTFLLSSDGSFSLFASKYLYINDTNITGNDVNKASGTGACGITYTNNAYVLRYVIGV